MEAAAQRYAEVVRAGDRLAVALDFDGTLAPIVEDPREAHIAPGAPEVLVALAAHTRALALITGRPAGQVVDLGELDEVGEQVQRHGRELFVFGQYGNERWSSRSRRVISPPPPTGLAAFLAELPQLLREAGVDPWIEEKSIAVAMHTRSLDDPQRAYETLLPLVTEAAHRHGLRVEPGRLVIEVRGGAMDKGRALRQFVDEVDARAVIFAGDDLGDLDAFAAVEDLRAGGTPGVLVCARPGGDADIVDRADYVVPGPDGVLSFLRRLSAHLARESA